MFNILGVSIYYIEAQLPTGRLELEIEPGPFGFDELLGLAARANPKRGFLFLSKLLGKHWPALPSAMRSLQSFLAACVPQDLPQPTLFIAMAETAIGLGHGVFESWLTSCPGVGALFLHTTRYRVGDGPIVEFAEAHSHAPRVFLHIPLGPMQRRLFFQAKSLVLIDDEISTGSTLANLADACLRLIPSIRHIHLAAITDFLGASGRAALQARLPRPSSLGSALRGTYRFEPHPDLQMPEQSAQRFDPGLKSGATTVFGRLGIARLLRSTPALADRLARRIGAGAPVLIVGTGEFMYPAFRLALGLEERGVAVHMQSTTRSPILRWGAVRHTLAFPDNYGEGVPNYLYNFAQQQYCRVLACYETDSNDRIQEVARALGAGLLHFRSEDEVEEVPVR